MLDFPHSATAALRSGELIVVQAARADRLQLRNFYPLEDEFAWTAGIWGEVEFDFDVDDHRLPALLELELDVLREPGLLEAQDVRIYLNGLRLASLTVSQRMIASIPLRGPLLRRQGNVLVLDALDAARPSDFGHADTRLLGVKLFSILLQEG